MKKIFRFAATLTGAFALVTGFTACSKDDDGGKKGVESCTMSYSDGVSYSYTITYYADGTFSGTETEDGETTSGSGTWEFEDWNDSTTWDEVKSYMQDKYDAKCN